MAPQIKAGAVRAIATTGAVCSPVLPDVPTMDEAGLKGYRATVLVSLVAPKGTPEEITEKLNETINSITNSPDVKTMWAKQGVVPMSMDTKQFGDYMKDQVQRYAKIIKDARIPSM